MDRSLFDTKLLSDTKMSRQLALLYGLSCEEKIRALRESNSPEEVERLLKKAAIIAKTLADMQNVSIHEELNLASDSDEEIAIQTLETALREIEPDRDIRTCSDFSHLGTECCEICHTFSPHYEMSLLDVQGGGNAWICCAMDRALNPQKHSRLRSSAACKTLATILDLIN
jgi:hypothetical protein